MPVYEESLMRAGLPAPAHARALKDEPFFCTEGVVSRNALPGPVKVVALTDPRSSGFPTRVVLLT